MVRKVLKSYRQLPWNIFQIQTKFRDEVRPRFGLMRGREFIMKDGYSFDIDEESSKETYNKMYEAYQAIFKRTVVDDFDFVASGVRCPRCCGMLEDHRGIEVSQDFSLGVKYNKSMF